MHCLSHHILLPFNVPIHCSWTDVCLLSTSTKSLAPLPSVVLHSESIINERREAVLLSGAKSTMLTTLIVLPDILLKFSHLLLLSLTLLSLQLQSVLISISVFNHFLPSQWSSPFSNNLSLSSNDHPISQLQLLKSGQSIDNLSHYIIHSLLIRQS
jgi:hypothetical protein